jgi:hypothetical protein
MTTVTMNLPIVLLLTLFSSFAHSQLTIEPDEFAMGNMDGLFDAIIDVRTADEWLAGHVRVLCILFVVHWRSLFYKL